MIFLNAALLRLARSAITAWPERNQIRFHRKVSDVSAYETKLAM
jgi:hypothetical protein